MREGSTSVPALTAELPITRQAIAKHLSTLTGAGLVEREPAAGREVRYRLRPAALEPAAIWIREADAAWAGRLERLEDVGRIRPPRLTNVATAGPLAAPAPRRAPCRAS